jgi:hypothetical protein
MCIAGTRTRRLATWLAGFLSFGLPRHALADPPLPRDPEIARVLGALAHIDLEAMRARTAAERFDGAYARDPHPRWAIAGAEAWMAVPNPSLARERYLRAAADPALETATRTKLAGRIQDAEVLAPIVERARRATETKRHGDAVTAWLDVFELAHLGRAILFAARAAEDGRMWADATNLLQRCAARSDLSQEEQSEVAAAVVRNRNAIAAEEAARRRPRPATTTSLAGGLLLGLGGALVAGGIGALVAADEEYGRLDAAILNRDEGPVSVLTRREALELGDGGARWTATGWSAIAAGALALGFGTYWVLREPTADTPRPSDTSVGVGFTTAPGGALLWARVAR